MKYDYNEIRFFYLQTDQEVSIGGGRILIVRLYAIRFVTIYILASYIGNFNDENIIILLL